MIDLVRFLTCASVIVKCNSKLQQLRRLQRLKQQPLLAGDKNAKALALQWFHHFVPVEWPAVVKEVVGWLLPWPSTLRPGLGLMISGDFAYSGHCVRLFHHSHESMSSSLVLSALMPYEYYIGPLINSGQVVFREGLGSWLQQEVYQGDTLLDRSPPTQSPANPWWGEFLTSLKTKPGILIDFVLGASLDASGGQKTASLRSMISRITALSACTRNFLPDNLSNCGNWTNHIFLSRRYRLSNSYVGVVQTNLDQLCSWKIKICQIFKLVWFGCWELQCVNMVFVW